jgi:hypothetical protein
MVDELRIENIYEIKHRLQSHFKVYLWSHKSNKETFIIITKKAKDFSADVGPVLRATLSCKVWKFKI